jgi:transposase
MGDDVAVVKEELRSSRKTTREGHGEVLSGPERRRRWSTEEKLRVLAQSMAAGSSVSLVCRTHGISSGQLYTWRKQFRTGALTGFAPVAVVTQTPETALPAPAMATDPASCVTAAPTVAGAIEVELPSGVKLRVTGNVEEAVLRRVLSALS